MLADNNSTAFVFDGHLIQRGGAKWNKGNDSCETIAQLINDDHQWSAVENGRRGRRESNEKTLGQQLN